MRTIVIFATWFVVSATASAEQQFEFAPFSIPESGRVVVPVVEGETLTGVAAQVDARTNGALAIAATEAGFTGESNATVTLYGVGPYSRVDMIGIGSDPVSRVAAEDFGGTAAATLAGTEGGKVQILWAPGDSSAGGTAANVAFGYVLRSYKFDKHQSDSIDRSALPTIELLSDDGSESSFSNDLVHLAEGVYLARNMSSEPANLLWPQEFVDRTKAEFKGVDNVNIEVLDEKDLQRLNMGAHWGVGKGSSRPPRLLIIEYMGGGDEAPVVLAGKGITFDTGGISLKDNENMWMMKGDLGGAGVVTGTVLAAARREAKMNVVALVALAENMPSGTAIRPGDVLTSMSGITIEILSTDAEGRLVLSDAVHYGQVTYNPPVLIDVATLTGSVGRALGDEYAGIFSRSNANNDMLVILLSEAALAAGEALWRLPLDDSHFKQIESNYGDIKNSGAGSPGASAGAAFIGSFVAEDQVWAHLDIAGVDYYEEDRPTTPKGYSGFGVRTLDEYLRRHHEND